jgi:hypothetical protein
MSASGAERNGSELIPDDPLGVYACPELIVNSILTVLAAADFNIYSRGGEQVFERNLWQD